MELKALIELVQTGGPSAIALLMVVLWWFERKRSDDERKRVIDLSDKLLELATTQADASGKTVITLATIQQTLQQLLMSRGS